MKTDKFCKNQKKWQYEEKAKLKPKTRTIGIFFLAFIKMEIME
jgi:hypothetical protein